MHNFRSGDEVTIDVQALVTRVSGDVVRIRFGDTEFDATPSDLKMIKRSMHVTDEVVRDGREGSIVQSLEEGVFLVRYHGATGADAYGVASRDELVHAGEDGISGTSARSAAPTPAPAPAAAASEGTLELTNPLPDEDASSAPKAADATPADGAPKAAGSIGEMAASLSNMSRTGQRRPPLDLESMGTTETVPGVRETRNEMTLGDDMRLGGSEN